MIAHPIFTLMGLNNGAVSTGEALVVVGLYVLFGLTALAIDRRALLVSALAYVLYALTELFKQFGAVELNVALTALVIGSALLLLSAYWHQARRLIVTRLPSNLQARLPQLDRPAVSANQPHKPALSGARTAQAHGPASTLRHARRPMQMPPASAEARGISLCGSRAARCGAGKRQTPPNPDRSSTHNRANGPQRPSGHIGLGSAGAPCDRMWQLGAGPSDAGTAR